MNSTVLPAPISKKVKVEVVPQDSFTYEFNGKNVFLYMKGEEVTTQSLLRIPTDPQGMLECLSEHAGLQAWIGMVFADAEADADEYKATLEIVTAETDARIREDAVLASPPEKLTEKLIEARITLSESYQKALDDQLYASRKYKLLRPFYEAIRTRGQLLLSVAGIMRDEARQPYAGKE